MTDIAQLLSRMTLEEKIGQLMQYNGNVLMETSAGITGPMQQFGLTEEDLGRIGSVLNFASAGEMKAMQDTHMAGDPNKIPMLFMLDVIHGYRTIYPIPLGLGCSFDPALAKECARMAAREAGMSGVQVTFAPMVDYTRDPRWGRVMETCGEDPLLSGHMGAAQVEGFQGEDLTQPESLAACVKHFAGYGGVEAGRDYNLVERSERELREFFLPAYKACIDAGASLLMPSFNSLNGIPSVANPWLMKTVLKEEWNYQGLVISDYNALGELPVHGIAADEKQAAKLAFQNGCDIEMCSSAYLHHLKELVEEGEISMEQVDAAVTRVLELKNRLGLFEDPYRGADQAKAEALFLCPAHREAARRAAEESAVLLKNDGLLPLPEALARVAIIGPFADEHGINGFWSCFGRDEDTVTVAQGIRALLPNAEITVTNGCGCRWDDRDTSGFAAAVEAAQKAQAVILCLGEPQTYSGEGNCRTDIRLPGMQVELARVVIQANPNTAVVLFQGRPLALTELDELAPAILTMWFPGTEGGNAAANLLFGRANPCGKLDMTFPRSVGQCPIYYNHPNTGRPHWTAEARQQHFASDYIDCGTLPLYSFGHGLSYSKFDYSGMQVSSPVLTSDAPIQLSVTVRNDSDRPGKEVVQLYMRDPVASVVRPVQQLIGYQKVSFAPHEEKRISFPVTEEMLRFWNFEGKHVSEPGAIELMLGYADHFCAQAIIELK
ncbi:MAG: glycoside hydrolase family 3 N-terminal domain-containing protein [Faecousia sp.]